MLVSLQLIVQILPRKMDYHFETTTTSSERNSV